MNCYNFRFIALLLLFLVVPAHAAPLPWGAGKYSHFSDQEPLGDLLKTLAASQDTPVVVSPSVKEVVSLHVKEIQPKAFFLELAKTYGLIWYYDKETLFIYKKDEAQTGSVSLKKMSPDEFTATLKRLEVLDDSFQWKISEVDNIIYFSGPERFVTSVLDMAAMLDKQPLARQQIYRWTDKKGVVNFSSEEPVSHSGAEWDVKAQDKPPGFTVVDVVKK